MGNPVTVKRVPETLVFRPSHTGQALVQSVQILNVPVDGILTATLASGLSGGPFTIVSISNYDVVRIPKTGQPTGDMTLVAQTDGKTPLRVRKGQLVEIFVQLTVPNQVSGTLTDRLIVSGDHSKGNNGWTFSVPLIALIVNVTVDFPDFDIHPEETKTVPVAAFSSGLVPLSSVTLHYVPKPFDAQFSIADVTLTFQGGKATGLASVVCAADAGSTFHYLVFEVSDAVGDLFDSFTVVATVILPRPSRWEFVGPQNYVKAPTTWTPVSGRVNAIAFDPNPRRQGTWYLGAAMGGLWKTTNHGDTWTPLGDRWKFLPVSSIAIDPSDSNTIYVGTGDVPKPNDYAMGIIKSVDGGQSWSPSGDLGGVAVSRVLVDPRSSKIVWATTFPNDGRGHVWQSLDSGANWTPFDALPPTWWLGIERAVPGPGAADRYYAVGEGIGAELWRTDDGGVKWTKLQTPLSAIWQQRPLVACSPIFPDNVYLFSPTDQLIYRSKTAGETWDSITGNWEDWRRWQTTYNFCLACSYEGDPNAGSALDVVYVGQAVVSRSEGNGKWQMVEGDHKDFDLSEPYLGHADQHAIAVSPFDPNQVLVGNDGGIFLAIHSDVVSLNRTLGITQVYRADYSSDVPPLILAGAQDNGTAFMSTVNGVADWSMVDFGDGGSCAICPQDSSIQYCTGNFNNGQISLFQTTDGWETSKDITYALMKGEKRSLSPPMICDPNRRFLYVATNYMYRLSEPYRSNGSWLPHLGIQSLSSNGYVNAIAIAIALGPGDSTWIYTGSNDDELWMSTNSGNAWRQLDSNALPKGGITWISVHPTRPEDILVGIWRPKSPSRLWRCLNPMDGRIVWTDVSGRDGSNPLPNVPVNTIARDPNSPDSSWFVGTDIGVFLTDDGGSNWYNATSPLGLPNVVVSGLKVVSQVFARDLYATTFGRGIWKMTL